MTIWLQAMAEAVSRAQHAWNWWGYSTHSEIAEAIAENQCWKDGCRKPEIEPLGLCERHLDELRRDPLEAP